MTRVPSASSNSSNVAPLGSTICSSSAYTLKEYRCVPDCGQGPPYPIVPKLVNPCCAPDGTEPSNISFVSGAMLHIVQCVQVPLGESGSSTISTSSFVPAGMPSIKRGGLIFSPSQVYTNGIISLCANALFVNFILFFMTDTVVCSVLTSRDLTRTNESELITKTTMTIIITGRTILRIFYHRIKRSGQEKCGQPIRRSYFRATSSLSRSFSFFNSAILSSLPTICLLSRSSSSIFSSSSLSDSLCSVTS